MDKQEIFSIKESSLTFEKLIENASLEIIPTLKEKNVVILPSHGHDDVFYAGTLDTLDYLNENKLNTDIYASDEQYKELSLHGAEIWLGTFIIQNIVIPIFCSVISSYIYDKLKAKNDDSIALKFIVQNKEGKSTAIEFNGKVENLDKVIEAAKNLSNEN
jgi:hypothetical protein